MKEIVGDIFNYVDTHWIVITTNEGWRTNGDNVMGAGLARYIRDNHPHLATEYGKFCREYPGQGKITSYEFPFKDSVRRFIMLPTKKLSPATPHLSWKAMSDLSLIEGCLAQLAEFGKTATVPVMVPLLGCSNGGLRYDQVAPLMRKYLVDDIFTLIYEAPF